MDYQLKQESKLIDIDKRIRQALTNKKITMTVIENFSKEISKICDENNYSTSTDAFFKMLSTIENLLQMIKKYLTSYGEEGDLHEIKDFSYQEIVKTVKQAHKPSMLIKFPTTISSDAFSSLTASENQIEIDGGSKFNISDYDQTILVYNKDLVDYREKMFRKIRNEKDFEISDKEVNDLPFEKKTCSTVFALSITQQHRNYSQKRLILCSKNESSWKK